MSGVALTFFVVLVLTEVRGREDRRREGMPSWAFLAPLPGRSSQRSSQMRCGSGGICTPFVLRLALSDAVLDAVGCQQLAATKVHPPPFVPAGGQNQSADGGSAQKHRIAGTDPPWP